MVQRGFRVLEKRLAKILIHNRRSQHAVQSAVIILGNIRFAMQIGFDMHAHVQFCALFQPHCPALTRSDFQTHAITGLPFNTVQFAI